MELFRQLELKIESIKILSVKTEDSFQDYRSYRNRLNSIIRCAKRKYYSSICIKSDIRKTWNLINQKIRPNHCSSTSVDCLEVEGEKISDRKIVMNAFR